MIQIEMSKDINDFSPKIISVFDGRQLKCIGIALSYGVPFALYMDSIEITTRWTIAIVLMAPVFMCGWVKLYGMPLERFVWHIIRTRILAPPKRYYATKNSFDYFAPPDPLPPKPATAPPVKRKWRDRKKYREDMKKYDGRK